MKNAMALLHDIAEGLKGKNPGEPNPKHTPVGCIEVLLYAGKKKKPIRAMDLQTALHYIANDITWDEGSEWSDADRAEVRSM